MKGDDGTGSRFLALTDGYIAAILNTSGVESGGYFAGADTSDFKPFGLDDGG